MVETIFLTWLDKWILVKMKTYLTLHFLINASKLKIQNVVEKGLALSQGQTNDFLQKKRDKQSH